MFLGKVKKRQSGPNCHKVINKKCKQNFDNFLVLYDDLYMT